MGIAHYTVMTILGGCLVGYWKIQRFDFSFTEYILKCLKKNKQKIWVMKIGATGINYILNILIKKKIKYENLAHQYRNRKQSIKGNRVLVTGATIKYYYICN